MSLAVDTIEKLIQETLTDSAPIVELSGKSRKVAELAVDQRLDVLSEAKQAVMVAEMKVLEDG